MNTTSASESSCGLGPRAWVPPVLWGLGAGLASVATTVLLVLFQLPLSLRLALVILPLLPALGYMLCVVRMLRRVDELQRRIQFEAIGFAFAATVILVMCIDLLEQAKILPPIHWGWSGLTAAMAVLWSVGTVIANRRYR